MAEREVLGKGEEVFDLHTAKEVALLMRPVMVLAMTMVDIVGDCNESCDGVGNDNNEGKSVEEGDVGWSRTRVH